jgi:predicted LPLAT superfamily acyltransferase
LRMEALSSSYLVKRGKADWSPSPRKKTKSIPNEQVGTSVQLRAMENDCRTLVVNLFRVIRMEIASRCIIVNLSESAQYSTKYLRRDEQNPLACRQHNVYSHPIYSFPEHFVCLYHLTDTSISCTQALVPTRSKRPDSVGIVLNYYVSNHEAVVHFAIVLKQSIR